MRTTLRRNTLAGVWGLVLATLVSGCQSASPIGVWQERLTAYISGQGNGDPTVLRNAPDLRSAQSLRPAEVRFSAIDIPGAGVPGFRSTRDVQGVLVGRATPRNRAYFIFVVGVNERAGRGSWEVDDLRLVAFDVRGQEIFWRVSPEDPKVLQHYLSATQPPARRRLFRHPDHQTFPRLDDVFKLEVHNGVAVVTEVHSQTVWRLTLEPPSNHQR